MGNKKDIDKMVVDENFWFFMKLIQDNCEMYKREIFSLDADASEIRYSKRDVAIRMLGFLELMKSEPYEVLVRLKNDVATDGKQVKSIDSLKENYKIKLKELGSKDK